MYNPYFADFSILRIRNPESRIPIFEFYQIINSEKIHEPAQMEAKPKTTKGRRAIFHKSKSIIMKKTWFVSEETETDINDIYDFKPGKNVDPCLTVLTKKGVGHGDLRQRASGDEEGHQAAEGDQVDPENQSQKQIALHLRD